MGEETERITVAETSGGPGGSGPAGETVSLPVVELLTGRGFVTGKSGAGKSILGGTPVYTENGHKPIEAVESGERVLSLNRHTHEQELREVQATIEHTDDRLLRITLGNGTELVGTVDHSFLTADGSEIVPVRGDDLERGMRMPVAHELPSPGSAGDSDPGESDIQWERVVSIESLDEERTVYDLDVAGNDNFLANGVFVHNSNSASVLVEKLLDNEFGLLIVDIDGEYYGLKEEYEILHVGADEECDIQVTTEHADRLAGLALEQNVPIILDVSSYLDESEAEALLTEVARSLFAKAKKQKQPFLLLVEEIHEYIPEQGSVGECGKMLIKIGKRGRKHGLGLCGISQRPADVKKDFITQCDWLLWHRLTWQNDTRVVRRILDGEYADAVENLDDGEGFLVTDWGEGVERVQFHRKETFDAGATPGLEDVERPALKSVSADLVSELESISNEASTREDRIAELESRLDRKEVRIEELEQELREAQNLQALAEQFVAALTDHPTAGADDDGGNVVADPGQPDDRDPAAEWPGGWRESEDAETAAGDDEASTDPRVDTGANTGADSVTAGEERPFSAEQVLSKLDDAPDPADDGIARTLREQIELQLYSDAEFVGDEPDAGTAVAKGGADDPDARTADGGTATADADRTATGNAGDDDAADTGAADTDAGDGQSESGTDTDGAAGVEARLPAEEPLVVRELKAAIGGLETQTRQMLAFYREQGPASAQNAHFAAGGDGNRTQAYARNRTLRTRGLVGHVGRGRYDYRLREYLAGELGDHVDEALVEAYATEIEETALDVD